MMCHADPVPAVIVMPCTCCQSEGRILRSNGGPDEIDCGECPVCAGTGEEIIETEDVEEEEIMDGR